MYIKGKKHLGAPLTQMFLVFNEQNPGVMPGLVLLQLIASFVTMRIHWVANPQEQHLPFIHLAGPRRQDGHLLL